MPSLVEAIKNKYDPADDEAAKSHFCVLYVPKSGPNIGPSGRLSLPLRLTLDNCKIDKAGEVTEIAELCEKVHELDLSKNALTDWNEVFAVVRNIPELTFLNLLMNRMDEETCRGISGTFPCMQNLVLNSTMVSWNTVAVLLQAFPSLAELHLSLNQYSTVDLPDGVLHSKLTKLFLNQCLLKDWADIVKLGLAFPELDSLNLIETDLETLSDDSNSYEQFQNLTTLNMSATKLGSWEEVDKFGWFPALTNLRVAGVPFLESFEAKQRRQHLIARLPNITTLNGSFIEDLERDDAERAFIRYFMDSDEKPARYTELEDKHGQLDPLVHVDLKAPLTIKLLVEFEGKAEFMDIALRQTVKDFKKELRTFTGLPPSKFSVNYVENFEGEFKRTVQLRVTQSMLSLNLHEGDEFSILLKLTGTVEDFVYVHTALVNNNGVFMPKKARFDVYEMLIYNFAV